MQEFLNVMRKERECNCTICDSLQSKISKMNFWKIPKEMLFIDDYDYNVQEKTFEKGSGCAIFFPEKQKRGSVEVLVKNSNNNLWLFFVNSHLSMCLIQKSLLNTFMIFYEDDTFEFKSFESSIMTIVYRNVNEIAKRIIIDKIKSIFYVCEMLVIEQDEEFNTKTSKERAKYAKK